MASDEWMLEDQRKRHEEKSYPCPCSLARFALCALLFRPGAAASKGSQDRLARSSSASAAFAIESFQREFNKLGYVDGKNIVFEYRYAEGKLDRLPALADELVRLKIDVIIAPNTPAAVAAKNATKTIPMCS